MHSVIESLCVVLKILSISGRTPLYPECDFEFKEAKLEESFSSLEDARIVLGSRVRNLHTEYSFIQSFFSKYFMDMISSCVKGTLDFQNYRDEFLKLTELQNSLSGFIDVIEKFTDDTQMDGWWRNSGLLLSDVDEILVNAKRCGKASEDETKLETSKILTINGFQIKLCKSDEVSITVVDSNSDESESYTLTAEQLALGAVNESYQRSGSLTSAGNEGPQSSERLASDVPLIIESTRPMGDTSTQPETRRSDVVFLATSEFVDLSRDILVPPCNQEISTKQIKTEDSLTSQVRNTTCDKQDSDTQAENETAEKYFTQEKEAPDDLTIDTTQDSGICSKRSLCNGHGEVIGEVGLINSFFLNNLVP